MKMIKTYEQHSEDWKRAETYSPKTAAEEETEAKEMEGDNREQENLGKSTDSLPKNAPHHN